jgi:hypothetical protein
MSFSQGFNVNNNSVYLSTQKIQEFSTKPVWNADQIQDIPISTGPYSPGQTIVYSTVSGTGVFIPGTAGQNPGGITGSVQFNNGNGGFTGDSNLIYSPSTIPFAPFGGLSIGSNQTYKVNNRDTLGVNFITNNLIVGPSGPFSSSGSQNTTIGAQAGQSLIVGSSNTFVGYQTGQSTTFGNNNAFLGLQAGLNNTIGSNNTFIGYQAGQNNATNNNTYIGYQAGRASTGGVNNTFVGGQAGNNNTVGFNNTFVGNQAGNANTGGDNNTFVGNEAGVSNTIANQNTFIGYFSGRLNTTGFQNTFVGVQAGQNNGSGSLNTFIGFGAGLNNVTNNNTFVGYSAGSANTIGTNNTFMGYNTGLNVTNQSGTICIGISSGGTGAGISGVSSNGLYFPPGLGQVTSGAGGITVRYNNTSGQMGPESSSLRFKENITDIKIDTTNIYNLRPVSYNYKNSGCRDFGLIAEEVNQYYPEIVPKDAEGPYSINYDRITVLLLAEIKKLKERIEILENRI